MRYFFLPAESVSSGDGRIEQTSFSESHTGGSVVVKVGQAEHLLWALRYFFAFFVDFVKIVFYISTFN